MGSLTDFALREGYRRVAKLGDKLSEIEVMKFIGDYRGELDDSIWNSKEYSYREFRITLFFT